MLRRFERIALVVNVRNLVRTRPAGESFSGSFSETTVRTHDRQRIQAKPSAVEGVAITEGEIERREKNTGAGRTGPKTNKRDENLFS